LSRTWRVTAGALSTTQERRNVLGGVFACLEYIGSSTEVNERVGVTTAGRVRAMGGDAARSPGKKNPHHATLSGLTPEQAGSLFRPTVKNPNRTR
jgi:hypothetical protein